MSSPRHRTMEKKLCPPLSARVAARVTASRSHAHRGLHIHSLLGLRTSCSHEEARSSYLQKAKLWHPDTRRGAHEDFVALQAAWDEYKQSFDAQSSSRVAHTHDVQQRVLDNFVLLVFQTPDHNKMEWASQPLIGLMRYAVEATCAHIGREAFGENGFDRTTVKLMEARGSSLAECTWGRSAQITGSLLPRSATTQQRSLRAARGRSQCSCRRCWAS